MLMVKRKQSAQLIYQLTLVETGETYIGLTRMNGGWKKSILDRFKSHCKRAKNEPEKDWPLLAAIREYGPDAFEVALIDQVRGKFRAHVRERELIEMYRPELNKA